MTEKTDSAKNWNFKTFSQLNDDSQKEVIEALLATDAGSDALNDITDADEFMSAQSETNGAMFDIDQWEVTSVDPDEQDQTVRVGLNYSASALEEQADLGGALDIEGSATLVVDSTGQLSIEDVSASADYGNDDEEEPDVGVFDDDEDDE